ncbi:MAG: hypothetical protein V9E94_02580 [Microthrixaceae bacterium]
MPRRQLIWSLLVVLAALLLGACEVRGEVAVEVEEDGSGVVVVTVRLDPEAARRLGDPGTALQMADLVEAGWKLDTPLASDSGLELRAERPFASPEDLAPVLDEIGGKDGVFREVGLTVDDGLGSTTYDFSAQVELTGNPEQFGDEALTDVLEGLPLARTPEELALEGAADPGAMVLDVVVELPGGEPETNGEVFDGASRWSFPLSGGEPTSEQLTAVSSTSSGRTRLLGALGALCIVSAAVLVVIGMVRRRG